MTDRGDSGDQERLGRDPGRADASQGSDVRRDDEIRDDAGRGADRDVDRGRVEDPNRGRGWGIAALIVSILSLISLFVIGPFNVLLAIVGLVLGIVATVKGSRGMGIASIVISVIALVLGALVIAGLVALFNNPEFQQQLQEIQQQAE